MGMVTVRVLVEFTYWTIPASERMRVLETVLETILALACSAVTFVGDGKFLQRFVLLHDSQDCLGIVMVFAAHRPLPYLTVTIGFIIFFLSDPNHICSVPRSPFPMRRTKP